MFSPWVWEGNRCDDPTCPEADECIHFSRSVLKCLRATSAVATVACVRHHLMARGRHMKYMPLPAVAHAQSSTSAMSSISTGTCRGSEFVPTAERACVPRSLPKTSTSTLLHPLMTSGCSAKLSMQLTKPTILTMRLTLSKSPTAAFSVLTSSRPIKRAIPLASSVETPSPTVPVYRVFMSSLNGTWPEQYTMLPLRVHGVYEASGAGMSGRVIPSSSKRCSV